jgi:hypothetical protein
MTEKDDASARVADVLKSSLESRMVADDDAAALAGHGSHVVSNMLEVVQPSERKEGEITTKGEITANWDDTKVRRFAERLSDLLSEE